MSAVEYIHSQDVSHRDLKPENILIDANNTIKIADFGLSNTMRDGHALLTSCGSPNYAAPEIIDGISYDGRSIDIWSCGIILYACLTGTLPFDEDSMGALFQEIKSGTYYMPPFLSEEAKDLINRML
jgi:5'-AMP-activated protein kinase catalytic alpha subunit